MVVDELTKEVFMSLVFTFLKPILKNKQTMTSMIFESIGFVNNLYHNNYGEERLKQLEGNAIYHEEFSFQMANEIATYICTTGNYDKPLTSGEIKIVRNLKFHKIRLCNIFSVK